MQRNYNDVQSRYVIIYLPYYSDSLISLLIIQLSSKLFACECKPRRHYKEKCLTMIT